MTRKDFEIFWIKHAVRDLEVPYQVINDEDDSLYIKTQRTHTEFESEFSS